MKRAVQGLIVLLLLALALPVVAAEPGKANGSDKDGKLTAQGQAVADRAMAEDLIEYGRAEKNPLALLLAAQVIKANPAATAAAGQRTKAAEGTAAAASGQKQGKLATADDILAEAKGLAAGNAPLVAMIDAEAKLKGGRGATEGPIEHRDQVNPGRIDVYTITFRGGELAEVLVVGDGDNDLDLMIYDENGNLIEQDTDATDRCYVSWTPAWTGPFKVKIKNLGSSVYSNYVLLTN